MQNAERYTSVAIALHWLIAVTIIALLAVGKWMTSLPETDALRFTATQWHKSFGILVLGLSVIRLAWKMSHRSPALPASMKTWEKLAAAAMHGLLYLLMFVLPLTGWLMVSASPLNLSTLLFGVVPLPHLPLDWLSISRQQLSDLFLDAHHLLSSVLLAMALFHVLAALRHQFMSGDDIIRRMVIGAEHQRLRDQNHGIIYGAVVAGMGLLALFAMSNVRENSAAAVKDEVAASTSLEVEFVASQLGEPLNGSFEDAQIELNLNAADPSASSMTARVSTASARTSDAQVTTTLPTADWFASEQYPHAAFQSTAMRQLADGSYQVAGKLQIRGVTAPIEFLMRIENAVAAGSFEIDRSVYGIGSADQEDYVGKIVIISFSFPLQ